MLPSRGAGPGTAASTASAAVATQFGVRGRCANTLALAALHPATLAIALVLSLWLWAST